MIQTDVKSMTSTYVVVKSCFSSSTLRLQFSKIRRNSYDKKAYIPKSHNFSLKKVFDRERFSNGPNNYFLIIGTLLGKVPITGHFSESLFNLHAKVTKSLRKDSEVLENLRKSLKSA